MSEKQPLHSEDRADVEYRDGGRQVSEGACGLYQLLINITSGLIRAAPVIAGRPLLVQAASFGRACHFHYPTKARYLVTTVCAHGYEQKKGRKETRRCILPWICVTELWSGS